MTHRTIELIWKHVKDSLPPGNRYKFTLQEFDTKKKDWNTVYTGYGITKLCESLDAAIDYSYRLCVIDSGNVRSDYSDTLVVRTNKEPLTGDNLHKAISLEKKYEVEAILDSPDGPRVLEIPDKFGNFPLMTAVNRNNLEIVELLILKGAVVNAQNEAGKTALMLAAFAGKLRIVKELRTYGASYDLRDRNGCTPLHYAVDGGNLDTIHYILMDGAEVNVLDTASGWTPLLRSASLGGNRDIADLLIKFNADVNVLDYEGKSALMIAVINGNQPLCQILIEHGADVNIKNEYGKGLYEMAVSMDRRRVIKYFDEINLGHHLGQIAY